MKDPTPHLCGSAIAALVNFPLWKASAMAQSGYKVSYLSGVSPPYRGALAVVGGMTWARAAIFYGSEVGRPLFQDPLLKMSVPAIVSTLVQIVNQPLVRGSIQLQAPGNTHGTVLEALHALARERGLPALWHGTSAGIAKTVPKYCVAVVIKDTLEDWLPKDDSLRRSAIKACTAATAGALLTNPLDVLRNEMFKTNLGMWETAAKLHREYPRCSWFMRGAEKNLVAVAVPVACTIFFTEQFAKILH